MFVGEHSNAREATDDEYYVSNNFKSLIISLFRENGKVKKVLDCTWTTRHEKGVLQKQ